MPSSCSPWHAVRTPHALTPAQTQAWWEAGWSPNTPCPPEEGVGTLLGQAIWHNAPLALLKAWLAVPGADPNAVDAHGWSAPLLAAALQRADAVETLVAVGGRTDGAVEGQSAWHLWLNAGGLSHGAWAEGVLVQRFQGVHHHSLEARDPYRLAQALWAGGSHAPLLAVDHPAGAVVGLAIANQSLPVLEAFAHHGGDWWASDVHGVTAAQRLKERVVEDPSWWSPWLARATAQRLTQALSPFAPLLAGRRARL